MSAHTSENSVCLRIPFTQTRGLSRVDSGASQHYYYRCIHPQSHYSVKKIKVPFDDIALSVTDKNLRIERKFPVVFNAINRRDGVEETMHIVPDPGPNVGSWKDFDLNYPDKTIPGDFKMFIPWTEKENMCNFDRTKIPREERNTFMIIGGINQMFDLKNESGEIFVWKAFDLKGKGKDKNVYAVNYIRVPAIDFIPVYYTVRKYIRKPGKHYNPYASKRQRLK